MAKDPIAAAKAAAEKLNKSVAAGTRGSARRAKGKPTDGSIVPLLERVVCLDIDDARL